MYTYNQESIYLMRFSSFSGKAAKLGVTATLGLGLVLGGGLSAQAAVTAPAKASVAAVSAVEVLPTPSIVRINALNSTATWKAPKAGAVSYSYVVKNPAGQVLYSGKTTTPSFSFRHFQGFKVNITVTAKTTTGETVRYPVTPFTVN